MSTAQTYVDPIFAPTTYTSIWGRRISDVVNALVGKVNRADIWREAAKMIGASGSEIPASDSRGKETMFDGKVFDPADPAGYLASLQIKEVA